MSTRRRIATLLIVLATLSGIVALITLWAGVQVFDTDEWAETSERVIESEEVQAAVADYLADELDRQGALAAGGVTSEQARSQIEDLLDTEQAVTAWTEANRIAHSTLIALVDERQSTESIGDGGVRLDLAALQAQATDALGVPDFGLGSGTVSFQVIPTDRVDEIQTAVDTARIVPVILLAVTLGLYLLAVLIAGGSRRRIGFRIGVSLLVIALFGFIVRFAGPIALDVAIAPPAEADDAIDAVWRAATALLVWLSSLAALVGAFLCISTFAWGRVGGVDGLRTLRRDPGPRSPA
ncbi:hypothetical protein HJD18_08765 [Thermoleophilia bacterium SCSIO 60948]|nr:hypothetical protein HJD18_08765 [Thermoleophilia bacterium SCSIO 60948]